MSNTYLPRITDRMLKEKLNSSGAVLIEGPKWCGKTSTAKQLAKSILFMQDPDRASLYAQLADMQPSRLLSGEIPRLLDEWQLAPILWDAVRFEIDKRGGEVGQFILTGSSSVPENNIMHSGTGRIARLQMGTMSLYESKESTGEVSLKALFDGDSNVEGISNLSIEDIAYTIVRGGWPEAVTAKSKKVALMQAINYIETVIKSDVSTVDNISKDPERVRALLRSLARNVSTVASLKTIRDDTVINRDDELLSEKTIVSYLKALSAIFVIDNIPAWSPKLRSKAAIRTGVKRQFSDPSIPAAILRITPERLFEHLNCFGFLFESLCERDLRIYAAANDGDIYHYIDSDKLEIDSIICLHDGRWAGVEIKLGDSEYDKAAENLLRLKQKIETESMQEPSFLMILTGREYAYRRNDGVYVVPIGCLKP